MPDSSSAFPPIFRPEQYSPHFPNPYFYASESESITVGPLLSHPPRYHARMKTKLKGRTRQGGENTEK
jgi:hypothetical protein